MAVNVTQKDQTLNEIIDFCDDVMSVWCRKEGAHARGYREALADVIAHCRDSLGYTGVMPLEVPNQSEGAQAIEDSTAEPRKEQIEAVAKTLALIYAYSNIESGYYAWATMDAAVEQGEDHTSYLTVAQRENLMEIAKRLLNAAHKAVR